MARCARSLDKLLAQINEMAPNRSTVSDGWIGDPRHAATVSDHNPNAAGVVTARDFTHDPLNGANMTRIAEALRESKDPRIKYVIWDGRMFSSYPTSTTPAWEWRIYTGTNPHTAHLHASVQPTPYLYDSSKAWDIEGKDWFDMATKADLKELLDASEKRIEKMLDRHREMLAVGKKQKHYDADEVNLKAVLDKK